MEIWQLIQDQILGMKDLSGRLGGSLQFFLYDVLKITVLLCCLIFLISYIQSYFPPERSKKILGHFHGMWANVISALLGTVTPFCSCSSIPLFMGFTSAGLPLGVTFSFLISSPMVDLGSLVLLMSIPMYADIFGTIPVAEALLAKGAQLGTILSFMMAVTTLSLPSLIMLRKAVKPRLLALFVTICTVGIILVGYLFNAFQFTLI